MALWLTFEDGSQGCATHEGLDADSQKEWFDLINKPEDMRKWLSLQTNRIVTKVESLPEAATPLVLGKTWATFCFHPKSCAGKHSCPRLHACND